MSVCIITGPGSGIGRATAIQLARRGSYDSFALLGRNAEEIQRTMEEMRKYNGSVRFFQIDFSSPEAIPALVQDIHDSMGEIVALYNIAGYTDPQPLLTTSLESFDQTFRVNVYSPFLLMRECVKYMKIRGGKILHVASTAGMTPRPGWLSYASSKAALISMSQTLTEELSEYGIMVYCVSPGRCATKLRRRPAPDEDPSTIMQPHEVAEVICNLMDPKERCLDGQNIVIRKKLSKA